MSRAATIAVPLLIALAVASALILAWGESPAAVYKLMLARTWGDLYGFGQVVFKATPLLFTGLAVALAFHAGLFNIGAEGQLLVGSFATGLVGAALSPELPALVAVPACVLAGAVAGGMAGALPGWLKARFGAHEVINTIMLNFVLQAFVLWAGGSGLFVEQTLHTPEISPAARLPALPLGGSAASLAFGLALAAAVLCWWLLGHTRTGYELRAVGLSPSAAEAGGIGVGRTVVLTMTLSGALAGLVGSGTVLGHKGYFEEGLGAGTGYMGIAVALLARNQPLAVIPAALLFGTLAHGGLAANARVPKELVEVIQAVIILAVTVTSAAHVVRRKEASWTAS